MTNTFYFLLILAVALIAALVNIVLHRKRMRRELDEGLVEPDWNYIERRKTDPEARAAREADFEREWSRRMCLGSNLLCGGDTSVSKSQAREDFMRRCLDPDA